MTQVSPTGSTALSATGSEKSGSTYMSEQWHLHLNIVSPTFSVQG